jgi:hypothetical protein
MLLAICSTPRAVCGVVASIASIAFALRVVDGWTMRDGRVAHGAVRPDHH